MNMVLGYSFTSTQCHVLCRSSSVFHRPKKPITRSAVAALPPPLSCAAEPLRSAAPQVTPRAASGLWVQCPRGRDGSSPLSAAAQDSAVCLRGARCVTSARGEPFPRSLCSRDAFCLVYHQPCTELLIPHPLCLSALYSMVFTGY